VGSRRGAGQKYADEIGARFIGDVKPISPIRRSRGRHLLGDDRHHDWFSRAEAKKDMFAEKPLGFAAKDGYAMAKRSKKPA